MEKQFITTRKKSTSKNPAHKNGGFCGSSNDANGRKLKMGIHFIE